MAKRRGGQEHGGHGAARLSNGAPSRDTTEPSVSGRHHSTHGTDATAAAAPTPKKRRWEVQSESGPSAKVAKGSGGHARNATRATRGHGSRLEAACSAPGGHQAHATSRQGAGGAQPSHGNGGHKLMSMSSAGGGHSSTHDAAQRASKPAAADALEQPAGSMRKQGRHRSRARAAGGTAAQPPPQQPPRAGAACAISSNWQSIRTVIGATGEGKRRRTADGAQPSASAVPKELSSKGGNTGITHAVAMDCEMVGVGPGGTRSALARVCIVNNDGNVLLDAHVRPKERVTDFRTWVSGIKPEHLVGDGVLELEDAQARVAEILKGAILVGHALHNDLKAMLLDHPRKLMRDTARYPPLMKAPAPGRKPRPRALRHLAREQLGLEIQAGSHSPVDDARAALYIYHKHRKEWERAIVTGSLRKSTAQQKELRKAVRESLQERAGSAGAARKARLGRGKGQAKIAAGLVAAQIGKVDVFKRDARDDPAADL